MNKELKMLLISILLVLAGFVALTCQTKYSYPVDGNRNTYVQLDEGESF